MKKVVIALGVTLLFLTLLGAIVFKVVSPKKMEQTLQETNFPATEATGATNSDPALFVTAFYSWYIENHSRDPLFPHLENREEVLSSWLTSTFIGDWEEVRSNIDGSPVFLTGEDTSGWGSSVQSVVLTGSEGRSRVRATIGSDHTFMVTLVRDATTWKIDSITNAE